MKRILLIILAAFMVYPALVSAAAMEDVSAHPSCSYCGMKRQMFAHSRMLISYSDKTEFAACSLHCAALDFANQIDKMPSKIEVAEYATKELINAETAVWVMGGKAKGVMTARPKWAFKDLTGANEFISKNGGEIVDFETAIKASFEDMYKDTMMIRKKRAAMRMKMKGDGQKKQ